MSSVKDALNELYGYFQRLTPTADGTDNDNVKYLKAFFKGKSDAEVKRFAAELRDTGGVIPFTTPNGDDKNDPKMEDILSVGVDVGYKAKQRVWYIKPDGTAYLSPTERLIGVMYFRRQNQTAGHSAGYADAGNTINTLTGQVTGRSKVTRFSFPEINLVAQYPHMDPVLRELLEFRGGNPKARRVMKHLLATTGTADHNTISAYSDGARINQTLKAFMIGASLDSSHNKTAG